MAATGQVAVLASTSKPVGRLRPPDRDGSSRPAGGRRRRGRDRSSRRAVKIELGESVLALVALLHRAAQQVRHELLPVADAQDRNAGVRASAGSMVGLPGS